MAQSRIAIADLERFFESSEKKIFWFSDLAEIFVQYSHAWNLPKGMTSATFVDWLLRKTKLIGVRLTSAKYPDIVRYGWGNKLSPVLVALATKRQSYLSHGSALWVHGLGGNPRELYVNHEQREKPPNEIPLTQDAIHRAFKNQPRHTRLIYQIGEATITILNGKHTGRLGVEPALSPKGDPVEVTSLERTLIDATVRPNYSGGVLQVMEAWQSQTCLGGLRVQSAPH